MHDRIASVRLQTAIVGERDAITRDRDVESGERNPITRDRDAESGERDPITRDRDAESGRTGRDRPRARRVQARFADTDRSLARSASALARARGGCRGPRVERGLRVAARKGLILLCGGFVPHAP